MDYPSPTDPILFGVRNKFKINPYRTQQVMDGEILVGTVEYDSPGWTATVLATGESEWFATKGEARQYVKDQRSEMTLSDHLEQALNVRFAWDRSDW